MHCNNIKISCSELNVALKWLISHTFSLFYQHDKVRFGGDFIGEKINGIVIFNFYF